MGIIGASTGHNYCSQCMLPITVNRMLYYKAYTTQCLCGSFTVREVEIEEGQTLYSMHSKKAIERAENEANRETRKQQMIAPYQKKAAVRKKLLQRARYPW